MHIILHLGWGKEPSYKNTNGRSLTIYKYSGQRSKSLRESQLEKECALYINAGTYKMFIRKYFFRQ